MSLTRDQVLEVLSDTEDVTSDLVTCGDLKFGTSSGPSDDFDILLTSGGKESKLTEEAYLRSCKMVGLPEAYVRRTPVDLVESHLNYWYAGEKAGEQVKLIKKNDSVIALTRPSIDVISNVRLLEEVEKALGDREGLVYDRVNNDIRLTHFSITGPSASTPRTGDVVRAGLTVQNSLVGEHPIEVGVYLYRLVCSNGAISAQNLFKWSRRHDQEDFMGWFASASQNAVNSFNHEFDHLQKLSEIPMRGYMSDVLSSFFDEYSIPVSLREDLMSSIIAEGKADSLYDIWNAVTYVASHSKKLVDNPMGVRRLMKVAGDMLVNKAVCSECHSLIKGVANEQN